MIFTSSLVIAGTAVDEPDELDAMDIALEDELDELDEDSELLLGLKGDDCPADRERKRCEYVGGGPLLGRVNARDRLLTQSERNVNIPY